MLKPGAHRTKFLARCAGSMYTGKCHAEIYERLIAEHCRQVLKNPGVTMERKHRWKLYHTSLTWQCTGCRAILHYCGGGVGVSSVVWQMFSNGMRSNIYRGGHLRKS
jgi:hypothetical protein